MPESLATAAPPAPGSLSLSLAGFLLSNQKLAQRGWLQRCGHIYLELLILPAGLTILSKNLQNALVSCSSCKGAL